MYPPEVSIYLNVGTFFQNALNSNFFVPNMSSTMIPAKSSRNLAKSRKLVRIWRNPANPLLQRHVPVQICSSSTSLGPKKIIKKREKKNRRNYCSWFIRITVEGIFGKKKFESAYIERNWNFGGVHCEFLNISDRIENCSKLKGANSYFSHDIIWKWTNM